MFVYIDNNKCDITAHKMFQIKDILLLKNKNKKYIARRCKEITVNICLIEGNKKKQKNVLLILQNFISTYLNEPNRLPLGTKQNVEFCNNVSQSYL